MAYVSSVNGETGSRSERDANVEKSTHAFVDDNAASETSRKSNSHSSNADSEGKDRHLELETISSSREHAALKTVILDKAKTQPNPSQVDQSSRADHELLPLHIATIFTLPVSNLGETLETYPTATSEPCKVTGVKTFLPAGCLPIELHDSLPTDFPKWEVISREDWISRYDLLFAYNPVEPFSSDESRLQRFESRIQFEALQVHSDGTTGLTAASKLVWIWFCTSFDSENRQGHHSNRVKKIVNTVPVGLVKELASIETPAGESVLEAATSEAAGIMKDRLKQVSEDPINSPHLDSTSGVKAFWAKETESQDRLTMGYLCRMFFNVREYSVPTSFVILPYRLAPIDDGTIGMASSESGIAALKFADCLLQLTDPCSILYYIDSKSRKEYGMSLYVDAGDESLREDAFEKIEDYELDLMAFYDKVEGYFYFIDEEAGRNQDRLFATFYL